MFTNLTLSYNPIQETILPIRYYFFEKCFLPRIVSILPWFVVKSLCVLSDIWLTRLEQANVHKMFHGLKQLQEKIAAIFQKKILRWYKILI